MSVAVMDPAPDWAPGYPSKGKRIGQAWQAMWDEMSDREWHEAFDLAGTGAMAGDILPQTARNMLFGPAKEGFIQVEARFHEESRRWRMWYRRHGKTS